MGFYVALERAPSGEGTPIFSHFRGNRKTPITLPQRMKQAFDQWVNSVALIRVPVLHGGSLGTGATSTGFIFKTQSSGHSFLVTSYQHKSVGSTVLVFFPRTGQCVKGESIGGSRAVNIMVVRIPRVSPERHPALPLTEVESTSLSVFDSLLAFDFPNNERAKTPDPVPRYGYIQRTNHAWGVLADFGRGCETAGGPVFNDAGEVIGIVDNRTDSIGEVFIPFNAGVLRHLAMSEKSDVPPTSLGLVLQPFEPILGAVYSVSASSAAVTAVVRNSVGHQVRIGRGDALHYLETADGEMVLGRELIWPEAGDGRALRLKPNQRVSVVFTHPESTSMEREDLDLETANEVYSRALSARDLLGLITELEPQTFSTKEINGYKFQFSGMRVVNPGKFAMPSPEEVGGQLMRQAAPGQQPTPLTENDFLQSGDLILGGLWHGRSMDYDKPISYFADSTGLANYVFLQPVGRPKGLWVRRGEDYNAREVLIPPTVFAAANGFFAN